MKLIFLFFYLLLLSSCNLDDNSYINNAKKTKTYSNDIKMDIDARDLEGLIIKALREHISYKEYFLLQRTTAHKNDLIWSIIENNNNEKVLAVQYKDYLTTVPTKKKSIFSKEILFDIDDIKMMRKDKQIDFKYLVSRGDERYGGLYRTRKLKAQIRVFENYKNMPGEKYKRLYLMELINFCNMFLVAQYDEEIIKNRESAIAELKKLENKKL